MTDSDSSNTPINNTPVITDVDLALFAEGLLSSERSAQVEQFLRDHPQLAVYSALWSSSHSEDSLDLESQTDDETDAEPALHTTHAGQASPFEHQPKTGRWWRGSAAAWKLTAAMAVAAIGGVSLWGIADARAIESTLSQTETILLTENPELSPQVRDSRIALEKLGGSVWLSQENSLRRDRLLASIYVTQAKLELGHQNQKNFIEAVATFPPLELCNQAVSMVELHADTDAAARQVLIDAHQQRAPIYYLFGTYMRSHEHKLAGLNQTSRAVEALLTALELLPTDETQSPQRLQMYALLFKALHKGGLAGQLTNTEGATQPASVLLVPRIRRLFSELPQTDSADPLSNDESHQLIDQLGLILLQCPAVNSEQSMALMDLCNSCGLRHANRHFDLEAAAAIFNKGLQLADSLSDLNQRADYLLTRARLLANLADSYRNDCQLDQEIQWRWQAIRVLREATQKFRTEEMFLELGWVTSAQLVAEYRWQVRHPEESGRTKELLGALRQISNDLESLNGYQVAAAYEECIYAIHAEDQNDDSLGRGAKEVLEAVTWLSQSTSDSTRLLKSKQHWSEVVHDFQNNAYFQQLPDFQQALKLAQP